MTVRYDCSISFDRPRSQVVDTTTNDTRVYRTRLSRQKEAMKARSLLSYLSRPPFIPAFLLDNEHPGYRKERMAYGLPKAATGATNILRDFAANESLSAAKLTVNRRFYIF